MSDSGRQIGDCKHGKLPSHCVDCITDNVRYWSYVTWQGMLSYCPENKEELNDFLGGLGISPYNLTKKEKI